MCVWFCVNEKPAIVKNITKNKGNSGDGGGNEYDDDCGQCESALTWSQSESQEQEQQGGMADAQQQQRTQQTPAVATGKKKCKNKKKLVEKPKLQSPLQLQVQSQSQSIIQPVANGHAGHEDAPELVSDADAVAALILEHEFQQLHICNGHGHGAGEEVEAANATPLPALNGHAHGHNNNNNNHIRSSSNSNSNSNNSHYNNNVDSSNNNKAKRNNSKQKKHHHQQQQTTTITSTIATSDTTANTQTTTATTTKTTPSAVAAGTEMMASTSVEAVPAAVAVAVAVADAAALPTVELQLEPATLATEIVYKEYEAEHQMHDIMRLIQAELSEPYSIYTYRYFIYNWPKLCFLASHGDQYVGAIVCKLDMHMNVRRGYIAMLAVRKEYRKLKIGSTLVTKAIEAMLADNADEVVLETEMRNEPALRLYENLGFVRDKRLFRYYLNGVDALRLKLWFR
ncbi:N-alpha-acetyltransferase 30A [Drosophila guanche]|uniref:N-terminal methionine N(alpha)-acetyltransferase NatC n=1 Tax=Drosophila guanche TaxID=7266 RepID=A0A3B0JYW2_DROGU|nr:N-alpha-acetyltransferase 30A [Drosophila guanche]SPP86263.1 blast:N-alpha-acetyltransferase 30 [Drosophila guanche]